MFSLGRKILPPITGWKFFERGRRVAQGFVIGEEVARSGYEETFTFARLQECRV